MLFCLLRQDGNFDGSNLDAGFDVSSILKLWASAGSRETLSDRRIILPGSAR
jgi:hypothetical protein